MSVSLIPTLCLECGCEKSMHRRQRDSTYCPCSNADCDCSDFTEDDPDCYEGFGE